MKYNEDLEMLEFSSENVVGVATIHLDLTEEDIETIMVGAIEGGIGYWARLDNTGDLWKDKPKGEPVSTWATKLLIDGHTVLFEDEVDDNESWELTLRNLIDGYILNYMERPHDNNLENGDIITFDCIIQYAIFNEVVYG